MRRTAKVPCGSCTLCCESELIVLHPDKGDRPQDFETVLINHPLKGGLVFAIKPNDDGSTRCRYLGPTGCTVYDKRPVLCREFDCRRLVEMESRIRQMIGPKADEEGVMKLIRRGKELIEEGKCTSSPS